MTETFSVSSIDSRVSISPITTSSLGLRISPEHFIETWNDPHKEHAKTSSKAKEGYDWVDSEVKTQLSNYRCALILQRWSNSIYIFNHGVSEDIVSLKRASGIDCVCHGKENYEDDFFYVYTNIFTQLHVRIPFDEFTIGVLRLLNFAPTQLHPNGWGYIQAFKLLCKSLYLDPSPECFLYFYCTRPREPASWVSLVRKPKAPLFRSYSDSFRNFKRRFFRIVVNQSGRSYFYNDNGKRKFPFYWTNNPLKYQNWSRDRLSSEDRKVIGVLEKLPQRMPARHLVRIYLCHKPISELKGKQIKFVISRHLLNRFERFFVFVDFMAQHAQKVGDEDDLFIKLRKQMEKKAKEVGRTDVPNLQQFETDIYHSGFDKKRLKPGRGRGVGKERKRLRATILGEGKDKDGVVRLSTEFGEGAFDISELEGPLIRMRKGVSIELGGHELKVINDSDPEILFRGLLEFQTRALVLSRRVVNMARKELKGESKKKLAEDLTVEKKAREEEHKFWASEKKKLNDEKKLLEEEVRRMKSWKVGCLEAEKKVKELNTSLKESLEREKAAMDEVKDLYNYVFNEHRRGFQKGIRQANFLYKEVSTTDYRFDVNKDIFDGRMLDVSEIFTLKKAAQEDERVVVEEVEEDVEDNSGRDAMPSPST